VSVKILELDNPSYFLKKTNCCFSKTILLSARSKAFTAQDLLKTVESASQRTSLLDPMTLMTKSLLRELRFLKLKMTYGEFSSNSENYTL